MRVKVILFKGRNSGEECLNVSMVGRMNSGLLPFQYGFKISGEGVVYRFPLLIIHGFFFCQREEGLVGKVFFMGKEI